MNDSPRVICFENDDSISVHGTLNHFIFAQRFHAILVYWLHFFVFTGVGEESRFSVNCFPRGFCLLRNSLTTTNRVPALVRHYYNPVVWCTGTKARRYTLSIYFHDDEYFDFECDRNRLLTFCSPPPLFPLALWNWHLALILTLTKWTAC